MAFHFVPIHRWCTIILWDFITNFVIVNYEINWVSSKYAIMYCIYTVHMWYVARHLYIILMYCFTNVCFHSIQYKTLFFRVSGTNHTKIGPFSRLYVLDNFATLTKWDYFKGKFNIQSHSFIYQEFPTIFFLRFLQSWYVVTYSSLSGIVATTFTLWTIVSFIRVIMNFSELV